MPSWNCIPQSLRRLARDEGGSALIVLGLGLVTLTGAVGFAIDMGRAQMVQSKMSAALDAAGLAAGATVNTSDVTETATRYFNGNFPASSMGVTVDSVTAVLNADNTRVNLTASGTVNNTFMRVLGINTTAVGAESEVTRVNKGMELVLVLDNTGSMTSSAGGGVSKINALKSAATDLVNILYGDETEVDNLWIGIVPFSQGMNIGSSRTSWVSSDSFAWGTGHSWAGCVDAREASNRDVTDDPPSVALFPRYYWPCNTSNNAWYGTNSNRDNCNTGSGLRYKSGLGTSLGPNKQCSQAVMAMTSNKSTILSNINSMQAVGNTHVNLGMAWGWRMISPRWRSLWGGEMDTNSLPLDYHAPLMNKVVILMTDGDNTIDNSNHGAYWYLSDNKLGTTNSGTAVSRMNTRTTQVCTSMKNNGVIIYTIALGTGLNSTSLSMLQGCASNPSYYFNSPTTADLNRAFHVIGDSLANLRISK